MTTISSLPQRTSRTLLIGSCALALSVPASANDVLFSTSATQVEAGQRTTQTAGLTQIKLTSGATISITQGTEYTINDDGSIDLHKGSITVAGAPRSSVEVRLPGGTIAKLYGPKTSASFSVADDGSASGHTLTGTVRVRSASGRSKTYKEGGMWGAKPGEGPQRTIANAPQTQPGATPAPDQLVAIGGDAGPVNAALNGIPVTLGDGLAGLGASSDIVEAGRRVELALENPTIERFPSGDFAALIAAAAQLEGVYGGTPFEAAQADIIRSYLGFLASGASGAEFLTAYSAFALQYLDLIRAGGVPSGFASPGVAAADIDAYLAFIQRTGALTSLAAQDQQLVTTYLNFLASGRNRDQFASSLTELTQDYLDFLRAGGVPTEFTGASQEALADAIGFLQQTGLLASLSASDQAFISAFVANSGADFAVVFQQALVDYFAFLEAGNLPSQFTALDQATLLAYIETLSNTGLLDRLPAEQAQFYADYLAFVQGGGNADTFAGLPGQPDFPAFAAALNAYATFLAANGLPSDFTQTDIATLQDFFAAVEQSGQANALLGDNTALLSAYFAFLNGGGDLDGFAGLPVYLDFVVALNEYFAFLEAGNLPSEYTELDLAILEQYLEALAALQGGLAGFTDLDQFFVDYLEFLRGGNDPDQFAGLPANMDPGNGNGGGNGSGNSGSFAGFVPGDVVEAYIITQGRSGSQLLRQASVSEEGGISASNFAPGTARIVNAGGDARGLVGTYTEGSFNFDESGQSSINIGPNQGLHYIAMQPIVGDLPQMGTIDYDIIAATAPTYQDGSTAPGTFDANLTVGFGSALSYGIDGTITMPDATYTFASPGRDNGDLVAPQVASPDFFVLRPELTGLGPSCFDGQRCVLNLFGTFGGENPEERVGFAYETLNLDLFDQVRIYGAVLFGAEGTFDSGDTSGGSGGGSGSGGSTTLSTQGVTYLSLENGREIYDRRFTDVTYDDATGAPIGLFVAEALSPQLGDAELVDTGSTADGNLSWGRWRNGQIGGQIFGEENIVLGNQGLHIFSGTNPDQLPTQGLIEYELIGSTTPTLTDGTTGTLDAARAVVAYGADSRLGLDFTVSADSSSYNVTTPGGLEGAAETGLSVVAGNIFGLVNSNGTGGLEITGTGSICDSATCRVDLRGAFYGDGSSNPSIGLAYSIGELAALRVYGTFALGPIGDFDNGGGNGGNTGGGTGGGTGGATGSDFTGTRNGQVFYTYLDGSLAFAFGGAADFVDGEVTGLNAALGTVSSNDADIVEATDLEQVAWARWTNGTVETRGFLGDSDSAIDPNGGYHVMTGEVTTSLPGGTIAYELIGGTSPTDNAGSAPGTLTGDLGIAFGSVSRVGYDLSMAVGGRSWSVSTVGGAADPASSEVILESGSAGFTFGGTFTNTTGTVTSTGDACTLSCLVIVGGTLYGDNAAYAALAMNVTDTGTAGVLGASGIAIFGQEGATSNAASVKAPLSSGADWSRWDDSASATTDAPSAIAPTTNPSLTPVTAGANSSRASAVAQAEAMMGGMISWDGAQQ